MGVLGLQKGYTAQKYCSNHLKMQLSATVTLFLILACVFLLYVPVTSELKYLKSSFFWYSIEKPRLKDRFTLLNIPQLLLMVICVPPKMREWCKQLCYHGAVFHDKIELGI